MKTLILQSTVLGLLFGLAGGTTPATRAEDKPAAPAPAKPAETPAVKGQPAQQKLTGKVAAVDKTAKTVTLLINGQTYVLPVTKETRIGKNSTKLKSLDDVLVGEEIVAGVQLKENTDGGLQVVVLSLDQPEVTAAQGGPGHNEGRGKGKGNNGNNGNPPFGNGPNNPNIDRPIISPNGEDDDD